MARSLAGTQWQSLSDGGRVSVTQDPLAGVTAQTAEYVGEWKGRQVRIAAVGSRWITVAELEKKYRRITTGE